MADAKDLKSFDENHAGSTPASRNPYMVIHTDEYFTVGQIVDDPLGYIYDKEKGYIKSPPFQVMEEVTIKEYTEFVTEYYGVDFLPSINAELFRFYRVSMD